MALREFENAPAPSGNSIGITPSVEAHDTTIITPLNADPARTWPHHPGEHGGPITLAKGSQSSLFTSSTSAGSRSTGRTSVRSKEAWASVAPDAMNWVASARAWKAALVFRRAQQSYNHRANRSEGIDGSLTASVKRRAVPALEMPRHCSWPAPVISWPCRRHIRHSRRAARASVAGVACELFARRAPWSGIAG